MRIDSDALEEALQQLAEDKLMDEGASIPDYATLLNGVLNTGSTRNKVLKDLKDLSPEASQAVRGSLRAELAAKALDDPRGGVAFLQDPKNRAGLGLEKLGMQPLTLGADFGTKASTAGFNAGQLLLKGGLASTESSLAGGLSESNALQGMLKGALSF